MADSPPRAVTPDDSLPPVEPPSAAFLVQLFLVPAIIVGIIVFVWVAFHWLAQLGNDPEGYVKTLRRASEGRWQAALNLANDLRGPGGAALKADAALAGELASILADEVASGRPRGGGHSAEQSRTLCTYLYRALGEFAVPEAAAPLVAGIAADDPDTALPAVEAIAVLADNLRAVGRDFVDPAAVTTAVLAASRSGDDALRSRAAYAIGVVGGEGAAERLLLLEDDAADNVRFNAAVGLARLGRDEAYGTLAEMLVLPDVAVPPGDDAKQAERYKRVLVTINALKAVGLLVDAGRQPPSAVRTTITALAEDPVGDVRAAAVALGRKIERTGAEPVSTP